MSTLSIKAKYKSQFRRLRIPTDSTLPQFLQALSTVFSTEFNINTHSVKYVDDEEDEVTLEIEEEWQEAIRLSSNFTCLKVFLNDKKQQKSPKKKKESMWKNLETSETGEQLKQAFQEATSAISQFVREIGAEVPVVEEKTNNSNSNEFTIEIDPMGPQQITMYQGPPKHIDSEKKQEEEQQQPKQEEEQQQPVQQLQESTQPVEQPEVVVEQPKQAPPAATHPLPSMEQSWTFVEVNNKELPTQNQTPAPNAAFVRDLSIPDQYKIPVGTVFVKTWAIKNTGAHQWPNGTTLHYIDGPKDVVKQSMVPLALPDQEVAVSVTVKTPDLPGKYRGYFKLKSPSGEIFGHTFWFEIEAVATTQPVVPPQQQQQFPVMPRFQQPPVPQYYQQPQQAPFRPIYPHTQQPISQFNYHHPLMQTQPPVFMQQPPVFMQQPQVIPRMTPPVEVPKPVVTPFQAQQVAPSSLPVQQTQTISAPVEAPKPLQSQQQQPQKWEMQLKLLNDMGFSDREALIPILEKNNGDVTRTVHGYLETAMNQ